MAKSVRESVSDTIDGKGQSTVERLLGIINDYDREFKKWDGRVDKLLKKYRDERRITKDTETKFNILWSNVNTLVPATFSKIPKPDVSRRFRDNDPVGRVASLILERALEYETEHYPDYYATMKESVMDRFLGGRGSSWIRYEPHIRATKGTPEDGDQISDDVDEPQEELDYECAPIDYVHWRDFGHSVARTWEEVSQVWRWVYMKMPAKVERFGEETAKKIPIDAPPKEGRIQKEMAGDNDGQDGSYICELWDKNDKKVYWFSKRLPDVLDEKDDPLGLEEFFPCPRPLYATLTNETLVPIPDFTMYQDQARTLDTLSDRIAGLANMLQVKGVYDAAVPELERLFTEGETGNLLPVKNWAAFAEKNGLAGAIDIQDLKPIYEALKNAYGAFEQVKQQIYDLTGISDIVRGQSEANETATAQRIKGQYASLRLKSLQYEVARYASEVLQLKAQVICGQFDPKTIAMIAGAQQLSPADQALIPEALALLVGPERMQDPNAPQGPNPMRSFRIEVNADTMIQVDEEEEKAKRIEFITAQGTFMEKALPMVQASPQVAPLVAALWKFSVGAFKVGKTLEGEFDAVIDKAKQLAAQPQPQKPDPEMARVQADQQIQQARVQADQQATQMKLQFEQQSDAARIQHEAQLEAARQQAEGQRHMAELQAKAASDQRDAAIQQDTELKKTALQVAGQIEVARINAEAKEKSDALNAAAQAAQGAEGNAEEEAGDSAEQAGVDTSQIMQQLLETQSKLLETLAAPKQVMRDDMGRVIGMQVVK